MPTTNPVAGWTRDHPADEDGRAVFGEKGETTPGDEVQVPAASSGADRPEPLGTTGRLAGVLRAMLRQACAGPSDTEWARANADRLLETIRVLSIL